MAVKYLTITDGGDGDFSWGLVDTQEEADAEMEDAESYFGVLEVDFDNQTIKRTQFCQ